MDGTRYILGVTDFYWNIVCARIFEIASHEILLELLRWFIWTANI